MWSDKGNDTAGGGYFGSYFKSSPSGAGGDLGEKKVYKAQNCVPVTVGHIQKSTEDNFKVGQHGEAHVITILGRLVKKNIDSTKLSYTIDDGTGLINCFDFKFSDNDNMVDPNVVENQYCRVYGSLRMVEGVHHLMAFRIQPIENINELTMHLLEVIYAPPHLDELENLQKDGKFGGMNSGVQDKLKKSMANVNVDNDYVTGGGNNISGFTPHQQAVYEKVKSFDKGEKGAHGPAVAQGLSTILTAPQVQTILEFLVGEGHIYSTTDDSHYRTTEA